MCMSPNYYQKTGKFTFFQYPSFIIPSNNLFTAGFTLSLIKWTFVQLPNSMFTRAP